VNGTIFRLARFSVHDGPGIRTTVFLKGCPLRCRWCHSPESQHPEPQLALHADRCLECGSCASACEHEAILEQEGRYVTDFSRCRACGACVARCPSGARELLGRVVADDDLVREIARDVPFFDESGGGVTFSGGEPFMQPDFLEAMIRRCRERGIHTAVDTCGMVEPSVFARIAPLAELVLFDVKAVDPAQHRRITGAANAVILENLRGLSARRQPVRVRFPLVPGMTDDGENVAAVGTLLRELDLGRVDLLAYHRAGLAKYERLGLDPALADLTPPTAPEIERAASLLRDCGLEVHIGG
jgi:pyruvate formate lyase activating enzyme